MDPMKTPEVWKKWCGYGGKELKEKHPTGMIFGRKMCCVCEKILIRCTVPDLLIEQ